MIILKRRKPYYKGGLLNTRINLPVGTVEPECFQTLAVVGEAVVVGGAAVAAVAENRDKAEYLKSCPS